MILVVMIFLFSRIGGQCGACEDAGSGGQLEEHVVFEPIGTDGVAHQSDSTPDWEQDEEGDEL